MLHLNKGNLETFFFLLKLFHSPLFFFSFCFFPFLWSPGQQRGCNNTAGCNQVTSITAYGVLSKITSLSETAFQPTTLWLHNRNSLRWATGTTSCAERVGNLYCGHQADTELPSSTAPAVTRERARCSRDASLPSATWLHPWGSLAASITWWCCRLCSSIPLHLPGGNCKYKIKC